MIDWIDEQLRAWAEERHRYESGGLGFPSRTVEARLMREGAGASIRGESSGGLPAHIRPAVHRMERAVQRMPPLLRQTVLVCYLGPSTRTAQAETLGAILRRRVGRQQLGHYIDCAHYWLDGCLAEMWAGRAGRAAMEQQQTGGA